MYEFGNYIGILKLPRIIHFKGNPRKWPTIQYLGLKYLCHFWGYDQLKFVFPTFIMIVMIPIFIKLVSQDFSFVIISIFDCSMICIGQCRILFVRGQNFRIFGELKPITTEGNAQKNGRNYERKISYAHFDFHIFQGIFCNITIIVSLDILFTKH